MDYRLIGAASGWGAQVRACEQGPEALKDEHIVEFLRKAGISVSDFVILYPDKRAKEAEVPLPDALPLIHSINCRLAEEVKATLSAGQFPIAIGGDHSMAVGTWNGVYQFFKQKRQLPLGLIWIDAHMDAHTLETSPSGAWHGMPVAGLLGHGVPELSQLTQEEPVLHPEHMCFIGIRSFEKGEEALVKRLQVRVYFDKEVKERGIAAILEEAIAHVTKACPVFGISLDLDVICPEEAPGVGSPEEDGVRAKELLRALSLLPKHRAFQAFELVEYNPQRDREKKTALLCKQILAQVMNPHSHRASSPYPQGPALPPYAR